MNARRNAAEILILCSIVFAPLAFGSVEAWSMALLEAMIFSAFLFSPRASTDLPARRCVLPAICVVLGIGAVQWMNPQPWLGPGAQVLFTASEDGTARALLLWSAYAALLWTVPAVIERRSSLRRLAWAIFLAGGLVAVIGIAQQGQGNHAYFGLRPVVQGTPFGPYANSDHAAGMMVMSAFAGLAIFASRAERLRMEETPGRTADLVAIEALILFVLAVIVFAIFKTLSRGAAYSMAASAGLVGFFIAGRLENRRAASLARAGLAAAGLACLAFVFSHPRWRMIYRGGWDGSTLERVSIYRSALSMFRDFPWFGMGLGGAVAAFPVYQQPGLLGIVEHVHSDWLELALQTGVVGLSVYCAGLAAFLASAVRMIARRKSGETRWLALGALAGVLAFLLHGMVDFSFQIPANAVFFFSLLAMAAASSSPRDEKVERPASSRIGYSAVTLVPGVCALLLIACAVRSSIAFWYDFRAGSEPTSSHPFYLSEAQSWSSDPEHGHELALAYVSTAKHEPVAAKVLLREALIHEGSALDAQPYDQKYRTLQAALLRSLGRNEDGDYLLPRAP